MAKARSIRHLVKQARASKATQPAISPAKRSKVTGQDASRRLAEALVDLQSTQRRTPRAQVIRLARSASWKFRRQLVPIVVIATTWLAGAVAHAARLPLVLELMALAGAVAWLFTRKWLDERQERVYAAVVTAAILVWLLVAAFRGVGPPMPAVLWASGCVLALPWWWRHRYRAAVLDEPDTSTVDRWDERVAAPKKALPGTRLTDVHPIDGGERGVIRLVSGEQTTDDAVNATRVIASAFDKPAPQVIVEPTPDGIESLAQLTILRDNPLRKVRHWTTPTFDPTTGAFDLGVHADGAPARFKFVQPGSGAKHALIVGTTGSGKTNTVNTILTEAHLSRLVVIWLIDPQLGQSLPDWNGHVDWTALGIEQAVLMLRAYKSVMLARSAALATEAWTDTKGRARVGKSSYELTADMPLHYLVLEEAHQLLNHPRYGTEAVEVIEDAGKMGRKTGTGVCLVNQMGGLDELGSSQTLRAMVSSGNVVVHRTTDRVTSGQAFSGAMPVEPHLLPEYFPDGSTTQGLGYLRGGTSRHAAMRTFLGDDPYGIATSLPALTLDPASRDGAGEVYQRRHEPGYMEYAVKQLIEGAPSPVAAATEGQPAVAGERSTLAQQIAAYLDGKGDVDRGQLIKHTGASPRGVANALNALITDGRVVKSGHGVYRSTDPDLVEVG